MKKKILAISFIILANTGFANEPVSTTTPDVNEKISALEAKIEALEKYIRIVGDDKYNFKKEEYNTRDVENTINIGTNKIGYRNQNSHHNTIVGNKNIIKKIAMTSGIIANTSTEYSTVIGYDNKITNNSTVVGYENIGHGYDDIIIGKGIKSNFNNGINIGTDIVNNGESAIVIGENAENKTDYSITIGAYSTNDRGRFELGYFPHFNSMDKKEIAKQLGKEYTDADIALLEKQKEKEKELLKVKKEIISLKEDYEDLDKNEVENEREKANKIMEKINILDKKSNALSNEISEIKTKELIFKKYMSTFGAVSVGNEEHEIYRQIIGVAAGSKDHDVVNVAQLKSLAKAPVNFYKDGKEIGKLELSKLALDFGEGLNVSEEEKDGKKVMKISLDNKEMKNNMSKLSGSVSNNTAMLNIPNVPSNKLVSIGAGFGYAAKSAAVAVGVSGRDKNNKIIYKASISLSTKGNVNLGAGINYSFGETKDYRDDEIEKLRRDNDELKERLEKLENILNK